MSAKDIIRGILMAVLIFLILFTLLLIFLDNDKWCKTAIAVLVVLVLWASTL